MERVKTNMSQNIGIPESLIDKIFEYTNNGCNGGFILANLDENGSININCKISSEITAFAIRQHLEEYLEQVQSPQERIKSPIDKNGIPNFLLDRLYSMSGQKQKGFLMAYLNQKGDPKVIFQTSSRGVKKGLRKGMKSYLDQLEMMIPEHDCED